jgi:signal peptidase I
MGMMAEGTHEKNKEHRVSMIHPSQRKKNFLQRLWYFIWDDDSLLSWIVNIVIAFVLIKFIVYPGLGLLFATSHPVVAVVSGSMEHRTVNGYICGSSPVDYKENFDKFWETCNGFYANLGITKEEFNKFSFRDGFNTGDIIVLFGKKPSEIKVGDVIVFRGDKPDPIIHRVVRRWEENGNTYYGTKGDHNPTTLYFENKIPYSNVIGKAYLGIPWLGYIKIWFVDLLKLLRLDTTLGRLF